MPHKTHIYAYILDICSKEITPRCTIYCMYIQQIHIVHFENFMNPGMYISEIYLLKTCDPITCALRYRYIWAEEPLRLDKTRAEKGEFMPHISDMYIPESLMSHKTHRYEYIIDMYAQNSAKCTVFCIYIQIYVYIYIYIAHFGNFKKEFMYII